MIKTIKKTIKPSSSSKKENSHLYPGKEPDIVERSHTKEFQGDVLNMLYWLDLKTPRVKANFSDFDFIKVAHHGITKGSVDSLASHLGISRKSLAEDIFNVSVKTLERKDVNTKLDKKTSSHALEIARVVQHAYEVLRDKDRVKLWVNRENKALNNLKPVQLFDTLTGLNMVNDILGRIEEGVYS
ncbi:MAG: DUF2384 domain-containing protein [Rhizobacter sp.]|nr:DUF2384 domain-containing protein [Ferruginibacter sp.]